MTENLSRSKEIEELRKMAKEAEQKAARLNTSLSQINTLIETYYAQLSEKDDCTQPTD
jgi:DNA repair exonuclease SbcCD ATPase subunit